jgi:hypothetical protein
MVLVEPDGIRGWVAFLFFELVGFQLSSSFTIAISNIVNEGGQIPCLDIIVDRIFPCRYLETLSDGQKRFLSVEENSEAQETWTKLYEKEYQKLLDEKSKDYNDKYSPTFVETLKKELCDEMEVMNGILNLGNCA